MQPYSIIATCTKIIQAKTQIEIGVKELAFGKLAAVLMKRFTKSKSKVISKPILPGTTS